MYPTQAGGGFSAHQAVACKAEGTAPEEPETWQLLDTFSAGSRQ